MERISFLLKLFLEKSLSQSRNASHYTMAPNTFGKLSGAIRQLSNDNWNVAFI